MTIGLYRAAIAMTGHERRLGTIAENLANVSTPGFKRSATATQSFQVNRGSRPVQKQVQTTRRDFSQGDLTRTGQKYDLALHGEGFFAVEGPGGELLTRNGSFQLTSDGVLTTSEGYPVAWDRQFAQVDPNDLPLVINGDGEAFQGSRSLGRLRVVDYLDKGQLEAARGGFFQAPRGLEEATSTAVVNQGALEGSNAAGMDEIISMISVQRSFEGIANLVTTINRSYSRLTRSF